MIPVGYMLKTIEKRPDWFKSDRVSDIYSVVSSGFGEYILYWRYNIYFLFDSPELTYDFAALVNLDTSGMTLFYYEIFEQEFEEHSRRWNALRPNKSFPPDVKSPAARQLEGFDVVSFEDGNAPEFSPLYCNSLADILPVNLHCLFDKFEDAREALEMGAFNDAESGPFRIMAVYKVESPA